MVSDEYPEYGIYAPTESTPTGSAIHLHVTDVDAVTKQASEAGAEVIMQPKDQFYGERTSKVMEGFMPGRCKSCWLASPIKEPLKFLKSFTPLKSFPIITSKA